MSAETQPPAEDADLEALVGPIAYREWQAAPDWSRADLARWARKLPALSDDDFLGEASSAIHGSALVSSWRGNWNHEHFKASFAYHEAVRRHCLAGHGEGCTGRTLYSVAHNRAARGQGYDWPLDSACDGTCGDRGEVVTCAQCSSTAPLTPTEHGDLCDACLFRQSERDDAGDRFDHLSASSFGFLSEDE